VNKSERNQIGNIFIKEKRLKDNWFFIPFCALSEALRNGYKMNENQLKQTAKIIKALADESRLRILCLLENKRDLCVCEITEIIGLAQPTISSHLKKLENADLVESYKDGLWVNYNIVRSPDSFSSEFLETLYKNLRNDKQIKIDMQKAKNINREIICRKKTC